MVTAADTAKTLKGRLSLNTAFANVENEISNTKLANFTHAARDFGAIFPRLEIAAIQPHLPSTQLLLPLIVCSLPRFIHGHRIIRSHFPD